MKLKHQKSIRHLKKCPDITEKDKRYKFEDLIQEIGLDKKKYKLILHKIAIEEECDHHSEALNTEEYAYLKEIVYTLALYGFQFKQIQYLLLFQVSNSRVGKWAKEFNGEKKQLLIKPIQICTDTNNISKEQVEELILKGDTSGVIKLIQTIYAQELIMYHIDSRQSLNIEQAKVLTPENREK